MENEKQKLMIVHSVSLLEGGEMAFSYFLIIVLLGVIYLFHSQFSILNSQLIFQLLI